MGHYARFCLILFALGLDLASSQTVDGGRSELPGMKRDIFDQVGANKGRPQHRGKGPPDCPKSDGMSPFTGIAFASGEVYVRLNSTQGECKRLVSVGGANYSVLTNASRTCGPAGEWKRRIAENLSAIFFQGGLDWVRSENETIEVITEEGVIQAYVSEAKYADQLACWRYGCGCEQAKNPIMRAVLFSMLVIAVGGLSYDSLKAMYEKIVGRKPSKEKKEKKEKKDKEKKKKKKEDKETDDQDDNKGGRSEAESEVKPGSSSDVAEKSGVDSEGDAERETPKSEDVSASANPPADKSEAEEAAS